MNDYTLLYNIYYTLVTSVHLKLAEMFVSYLNIEF